MNRNADQNGAPPSGAAPSPSAPIARQTPAGQTGAEQQKDLLSIGAGAFVFSVTSEHNPNDLRGWSAYGLIDEDKTKGWAASSGNVTDGTITLLLPARTTLKTVGFDTAGTDTDGAAVKDISVEVSDLATSGFQEIFSGSLTDKKDGQDFPVGKEIAGRYVRITAKNNFGSNEWLELLEVRGYGVQEPVQPYAKSVSGTYETGQWGDFHIKQEGTSVVGCYEHEEGVLEGGFDGRVMTLNWKETGTTERDRGPAVFLFDDEANKFVGIWGYSDEDGYTGTWNGERTSDKVGGCSHFKNLGGDNAAGSRIEEDLQDDGRATVYGINFDFDSDRIKNESKPTLDQIAAILKDRADWKMIVEGHTDNVGGEAFNQTLSEKRAEAVKTYLSSAGVDGGRLTAKGMGLSKPIAENDSEAGRARNRRVELVKQ